MVFRGWNFCREKKRWRRKKEMGREEVRALGFARAEEFFLQCVRGWLCLRRMLLRLLLCLLFSKDLPVVGTRGRTLRLGICFFPFFSLLRISASIERQWAVIENRSTESANCLKQQFILGVIA